MKGVYCLIIFLNRDRVIRFGKAKHLFKKGFYCYVGSALNSLEKRIERHLSKNKKKRWIITDKKIECELSKKVQDMSDDLVPKFGSSDCKCRSHLYYFNKNPLTNKEFLNLFG